MDQVVALYCRISQDRSGRREGVDAQERWGREYAAEHWPGVPVEVFPDNDLSAADPTVIRPEYDRLLEWIRDGRVLALWAVEQSRLQRDELGWFALRTELTAAGITLLHTKRDGLINVGDDVASIKAILAAGEARRIRSRVSDKLADRAARGLPAGGAIFGYSRGADPDGQKTLVINEEQADAIRYAADQILAGRTLTSVASELTERGIKGARGAAVNISTVRRMVTTATVAGIRVHKGIEVGPGSWPAILDEATYRQLVRKLGAVKQRARRKYLLTGGLATCAVCEAPLAAQMKLHQRRQVTEPYYLCAVTNGGRGCVGILAQPLEDHVADELFRELDKPAFLAALSDDSHRARRKELTARLDAIEAQRRELARMWATPGSLSTDEWGEARQALDAQERAVKAELAALPAGLGDIDIAAVKVAWPRMDLGPRRAFLDLFVADVAVGRAKPGTKTVDLDRVDITFRSLR